MKRFSMAMTWLAVAGLMTTVSCRKPVMGFTNGEARTVTVSAVTESGGGSKTSIDGLNVKWSKDDQIRMNAESVLTLEDECAGSTMGRFTGEVKGDGPYYIGYPEDKTTYDGTTLKLNVPALWTYADMKEIVPMVAYAANVDDDVYFRNAVNMLKLQLTGVGDDDNANKLKRIVLTSTTSNLSGDIRVTFEGTTPTFNAITDGEGVGKTMTVLFGDGLQLTAEATCVYIPLAKIAADEVLTVRFICAAGEMKKKVTATSSFNAVNNMLDGDVVEVKAVPVFSVGKDGFGNPITVEFAPGNLYYDGSAFRFEADQWSFTSTWNASHVSHFFWSKTASVAYAEKFSGSGASTGDVFFTNATETTANPNFQVNGETAGTWRTLSNAEWAYLLNSRANASSLRAWKDLGSGIKGLVILPDGTDASVMSSITSTEALATHGAVFLPAAGRREGTGVNYVGSRGYSWSSTPREDNAYSMYFHSGDASTIYIGRNLGLAARLVR